MSVHDGSQVAQPSPALIDRLQRLIERTYDHDTGIRAADFVIGDDGLDRIYRDRRVRDRRARVGEGPMLLLRCDERGLARARVYLPNELVDRLERHDPLGGVGPHNLDDFASLVEELDHLLLTAAAWRSGRPVRGVELELHANVTKSLTCSLFVARTLGVATLDPDRRAILHERLFGGGDYEGESPELARRYRDARRHALRFLGRLAREPVAERPSLLRRFSRAPLPEKLRLAA